MSVSVVFKLLIKVSICRRPSASEQARRQLVLGASRRNLELTRTPLRSARHAPIGLQIGPPLIMRRPTRRQKDMYHHHHHPSWLQTMKGGYNYKINSRSSGKKRGSARVLRLQILAARWKLDSSHRSWAMGRRRTSGESD